MSGLEVITLILLLGILGLSIDIRREMCTKDRPQSDKANEPEDERIAEMTGDSIDGAKKRSAKTSGRED